MKINSDLVINIDEKTLALPEFEGFPETVKVAFATLSERAPSDSGFRVAVSKEKLCYRVAIFLNSSIFDFTEWAEGQSPFTALDRALVKAKRRLEFWSVQKNLGTAKLDVTLKN